MPLGILSDSDFESELGKFDKTIAITGEVMDMPKVGRVGPAVPEVVRTIIGEDAIENGNESAKQITKALAISDSSLSAYKVGANSTATYNKPNDELKKHLDNKRRVIITASQNTLLDALANITPEKLSGTKARDLAAIARDMSATIRNMDEDGSSKTPSNQPLVIFAPMIKEETAFEVINAKD